MNHKRKFDKLDFTKIKIHGNVHKFTVYNYTTFYTVWGALTKTS